MARDTVSKTILVAAGVCLVCATLVSSLAVGLSERQEANRAAEVQKNILVAAGIYNPEMPVEDQFGNVEAVVIDLETGEVAEDLDPETYDQRAAANDPAMSKKIDPRADLAGIRKRARYAPIYLVRDDAGEIDQYVLPVNGKGLWSTLYGMLALQPDLNTVNGMIFYEHKETPGLGGEVDNPRWKAQWPGKKIFDEDGDLRIEVIKGIVRDDDPAADYRVDGLTGATITARGVQYLVRYWMGHDGFGPFIERAREEGVARG